MKLLLKTILLSSIAFNAFAQEPESITTNFIDNDGEVIGVAVLSQMEKGVLLDINIVLPSGVSAMHIHEKGNCDKPDFKTAGGHFNPHGKEHGINNTHGAHVGDLPNLVIENGLKTQQIFLNDLKLEESETGIKGRSIIIHEGKDDYISNPSGNAGRRIACAVI